MKAAAAQPAFFPVMVRGWLSTIWVEMARATMKIPPEVDSVSELSDNPMSGAYM